MAQKCFGFRRQKQARHSGVSRLMRLLGAPAILVLLAGCQTAPAVSVRPTPHTLVYAYLMAHGMARGCVMSGGLDMAGLKEVMVADRFALLAVMLETAHPSDTNMKQASQAVQRLLAAVQPADVRRMSLAPTAAHP